jgi:hypothetical protein
VLKKIEGLSPVKIAFLQSLSLLLYIALVALIFWRGNQWFGPMNSYLGPILVLCLLVVSALICAILTLGIPFYLAWEEKKTKKAIKIVVSTALWLLVYFLIILGIIWLRP